MAKKLKTFVTSMGFFDLAVAAPSMKAAMDAWGVKRNLFHLGAASETGDRAIIAAAMAKPGTVLKRPVGTSEPFHEDAALPAGFSLPPVKEAPAPKTKAPPKAKKAKPLRAEKQTGDTRAAIISFEKARAERERARAREDAAAKRDAQKRASAVEKAQTQLEDARQAHQERRDKLTRELESRLKDEETRWNQERRKLEAALDKARKS